MEERRWQKKRVAGQKKFNARLLDEWYDDIDEGREPGYPEWFDHGKRGPDGVVRGDQRPFSIQRWHRPSKPEKQVNNWVKEELKNAEGQSLQALLGK